MRLFYEGKAYAGKIIRCVRNIRIDFALKLKLKQSGKHSFVGSDMVSFSCECLNWWNK